MLLDLPGHGPGGRETAHGATLAGALARLGSAFDGAADVVGYSMGGRLALHFAVAHPSRVRGLVLESASPGLADAGERRARRRADAALAERIEAGGVEAFVAEWERLPLFETQARLDPAVLERQRAVRLAGDPTGLAAALRGLGTGALPPLWDRLGEVEAPTLLIVGARDRKFTALAERMAERLPASRLVVVAGCGHNVHLEQPAAWLDAVCGFLAER